jgi:HAD superfamily hydrolase (TIGR01484 family)
MRYIVLATDYDGTLADDGIVSSHVIAFLERLRHSGRRLVMVTGRELPDLQRVFTRLDLFERVVVENGALLYNPASRENRLLTQPASAKLVERLKEKGVTNLSTGEAIVALWRPHEQEAIDAIRDLGLELQITFNKGAVMILPSGVNKMTGLVSALKEMKISRHGVVGVGDAENDHAFLGYCHCAVAVANAIPSLKDEADLVTQSSHGEGVAELIEELLEDDLSFVSPRLVRHNILLGKAQNEEHTISPYGTSTLVCGHSGSGKSTLIAGLVERIAEKGYQICLIDPEGDYELAEQFKTTGSAEHAPSLDHLEKSLEDADAQLAVNLVGVALEQRPALFGRILALVQEHRLRTGRPHWLIIDEAHHVFPTDWVATEGINLAGDLGSLILVAVHPGHVSPRVLRNLNMVVAVGREPVTLFREFCQATGRPVPAIQEEQLELSEGLVWSLVSDEVTRIKVEPPRIEHERHRRKYAQGQLEEERVFYFRGPENRLRLRADNLNMFVQIAQGVDDDTWLYHLKRGDFSRWLREAIKDREIAEAIQAVERGESLSASQSRAKIADIIQSKYTAAE